MRAFLLAALFCLLVVAACAQQGPLPSPWSTTWTCSAGTCTGNSPGTFDAGMPLGYVDSYRVAICAASTFTLSGAGTMQAWWGSNLVNLPLRDSPLDQTTIPSGVQCATWPDFRVGEVSAEADYVEFVPNGITVSGGAGLTEYIYPHKGQ